MRAGISKGSKRTTANISAKVEQIENVSGKAAIQANKDVYNLVTMEQAKGLAERVYIGKSKLCSSYAWDTALKFMEAQNSMFPTNSVGGYYGHSSIVGPIQTGYDTMHLCNIYDMGGNVWEWTTDNRSEHKVYRGNCYKDIESVAANRTYSASSNAKDHIGFRITLFM